MLYNYDEKNKLEHPEFYMYSKYYGRPFLKDYFKKREEGLNYFKTRLGFEKNTEQNNMISAGNFILSENTEDEWELNEIISEKVLKDLYYNIVKDTFNNEMKKKLDGFLKRFEVKKRIYARYSNDFMKFSGDYKNFYLYALLSLDIALYYKKNPNLKYLNTLLKLNDFNISVKELIKSENICKMIICSIMIEMNSVKNLLKRNNIVL